MFLIFENVKNNSESDYEEIELTPMNTSRAWAFESGLLDIYALLVHRIEGLGWSLKDFWEADTWTTSKLYCLELDLIEEEEKELKKGKKGKRNPKLNNSPKVDKLYGEMFDED